MARRGVEGGGETKADPGGLPPPRLHGIDLGTVAAEAAGAERGSRWALSLLLRSTYIRDVLLLLLLRKCCCPRSSTAAVVYVTVCYLSSPRQKNTLFEEAVGSHPVHQLVSAAAYKKATCFEVGMHIYSRCIAAATSSQLLSKAQLQP